MDKKNHLFLRLFIAYIGAFMLVILMNTATFAQIQVGLYNVFETQIINSNAYANPFDFNEIELRSSFTSPSGKNYLFFGFYDGDGQGGQTGNVWKQRFMPDEVGTWTYTYAWSDNTPGGSGSFVVVDTGLPGPLKTATDRSWYFMDARGNPFHFRGYDTHSVARYAPTQSILNDGVFFKNIIQTDVINPGYNFAMMDGVMNRSRNTGRPNTWRESWWLNTSDTKRFDIPVWRAFEEVLSLAKDNRVYVINFSGMIHQGDIYSIEAFKVFLRYWVARFGAYYNYFGWSPTWEWGDVLSTTQINEIMQYVYNIDPWKRLLTSHDHSDNAFTGWLGFSMRQQQSRTVFDGNIHGGGIQGGVGSAFTGMPIIGSEDIWETPSGAFGQPRNNDEVRRGAWGIMMAGVMPLYSEWHPNPPPTGGNGLAEPEVRRMFDFFYSKTTYRQYQQMNGLVSSLSRQIASGISGQEYLIYDEDGGSITIDLSAASASSVFAILWFDPKSGVEQSSGSITGGGLRSVSSPFSGDSVLLLKSAPTDTVAPSAPIGLSVN